MQISEELIKQITNAVLSEMGQETGSHTSSEVPSMAGRDRINEEKTSYRDYPRAKQGTDPKEVVIGVGAAFQKEIKRTICGILLEDVLKNVKAGIEEEGMIPRVVKILDTSDVCFYGIGSGKAFWFRNRDRHPVERDNRDPSERPLSAFQSGIVSAGASDESGDLPSDRTECCQICKG